MKHKLVIKGMHCSSCKSLIIDALEGIGAEQIEIVNMDEKKQIGTIIFQYNKDIKNAVLAIEEAGYSVAK